MKRPHFSQQATCSISDKHWSCSAKLAHDITKFFSRHAPGPNASDLLQKSGREWQYGKKVRSRRKENRHPRMQCSAYDNRQPQPSRSTGHDLLEKKPDHGPCTPGCDRFAQIAVPPTASCSLPSHMPPTNLCYPISAGRVVPILLLELTLQPNLAKILRCDHYDRGVL